MIKKGLIAGTIALIIVLGTSYFTGNWSYIYYVSGTLGLASVALALVTLSTLIDAHIRELPSKSTAALLSYVIF
ncbi:hypothetical protein [Priestia aryabhattai]|uniref:hypothetical protein n=1 Tax=Priestia aryabhattai TaxID=412384 RepID=UPI0003A50EBC